MAKLQLLLISLINIIFVNYSISQNRGIKKDLDSLTTLSQIFLTEDPQKALGYSLNAVSIARNIDKQSQVESWLLLSEVYLNNNSAIKAQLFCDSALNYSERTNNPLLLISAYETQAKIYLYKNEKDNYISLLNKSRQLVHRKKNVDQEVYITLLIGDFQKQNGRFKESIKTKKIALDIAKKSNNNELIAECWKSLGSTYWNFSHFNEALEHFYKSYIIFDKIKDTNQIVNSLKNISLCYRDIGDYDKSLSQLNLALQLLEGNKDESAKAEILNTLGSLNFRFNRFNEAINYYKQSLEIREKLGFLTSTANSLENLARAYLKKNQYDEAIDALNKAFTLRNLLFDQLATASTLNEMGNLHNQKGNIAEALRRYLQSLKIRQLSGNNKEISKSLTNIGLIYRKLGLINYATKYLEEAKQLINIEDPQEASNILINLGNVYLDQKLYDKALLVFQEALQFREKTGDEISIAKSLKSLALAQQLKGQYDKAFGNLQKSLKIVQKLNDGRAIADALNEMGNIERQRGRLKEAKSFFEKAALTYDESAVFDGKALCLRKIGEVQVQLKQLNEAEKNIDLSINLGRELGSLVLMQYGYLAKHNLYKAKNNYKQAYEFYVKHIKLRDSIELIRKSETNLEAQLDLELDKKKEEIKAMEVEVEVLRKEAVVNQLKIEKQRLNLILLISFLTLILTIAGGAVYLYFQKKKHNKTLEENIDVIKEMNDKLAQSEIDLINNIHTKNKLFSIIAHDLKSPFTGLVGLTGILATNSSKFTKDEIEEYSKQINISSEMLLALIENLLTWSRSQTGALKLSPEEINIKTLIDSCFELLGNTANEKKITLISNIQKNTKVYADIETITIAFRNLISNAIKFTKPGGNVIVSSTIHNDFVDILISDNGIGIEPKNISMLFQINKNISTTGTNNEKGTGLGLIICKEFIEKNKGKINVESELNVGTTFKVTLPKSI